MPALKDTKISVVSNAGQKLKFSCKTTVDGDGKFHIVLPEIEELEGVINLILDEDRHKENRRFGGVRMMTARINPHLIGPVLADLVSIMTAAASRYMTASEHSEMVILYKYDYYCHYALDEDGGVWANGYDVRNGKHKSMTKWAGSVLSNSDSGDTYRIGLGAGVFEKITRTRGGFDTVVYKPRPSFGERSHFETELYGERLNAFVRLHLPEGPEDDSQVKEIPYTEEAAKFFYDFILSLCKLHKSLDGFFGENSDIQAVIGNYVGGGLSALPNLSKGEKNDIDT